MAKIIAKEDCGNASKKKFIQDLLMSLANREAGKAMEMLTDDACLDIVGKINQSVFAGALMKGIV